MARRGRPKKVQPEHLPVLREIVTNKPLATLTEIRDTFAAKTGVSLYIGTLRKELRKTDITRHKGTPDEHFGRRDPEPEESPARYGYQDRPTASSRTALSQLFDRCRMGVGG